MKVDKKRRALLRLFGTLLATGASSRFAFSNTDSGNSTQINLGDSTLTVLSDGNLSLPINRLYSAAARNDEAMELFEAAGLSTEKFHPPLNITLMQSADRLVLFDIGSGAHFMDTAGLLPAALESSGIDPLDVTDVVFTHAHPDHCWGLLDDFDELLCPNATYHMHGAEYDYWLSEDTLNNTAEASLGMVAGARNRLPLIQDQLQRFHWGDEVLPGIEAVDSHGHTPGHTAFAVHGRNQSVMVLGDALVHPVLSFQRPHWPWRTDVDAEAAADSRIRMLDRLLADNMNMIGYHLPASGYGAVEKHHGEYRFSGRNH